MEIDLCLVANSPESLQKFLRNDQPAIRKWREAIYEPNAKLYDGKQYLQSIRKEHLEVLQLALETDRLMGARLVMKFFCQVFQVTQALELKIADEEFASFGDFKGLAYFNELDMDKLEMREAKLLASEAMLKRTDSAYLVGAIAHEMWHAHQYDAIFRWLRQSGGLLDLELVDPYDEAARGALYALGFEAYILPQKDNMQEYIQQLIEAEAEAIRAGIAQIA